MGHIRPGSTRREHRIAGLRVQYRRKADPRRVTPWLYSWIGFPVDSEPVDYLILDGGITMLRFLLSFLFYAFRYLDGDGDVIHHIGFSCRRGLETSEL